MHQGHKTALFRVRLLLAATFAICLALFAAPRAHASTASQSVDQALAAAKAWVAQIDAGKYEDSYSFTCDEVQRKVAADRWADILKTIRAPWGSMVTRHQLSHVYQPNGIKGHKPIDGECMVIIYSTNFKNYANVTEEVDLKWQDGQWRGAGYTAGVVPDENASDADNNNNGQTEVQTQEHVKPQPNSP
jgi:hypothetical protein